MSKYKTHCPTGHPYDAENTMVAKNGVRKCKICLSLKRASKQMHYGQIRRQGKIPNAIALATGMTQRQAYLAFWKMIEVIRDELFAGRAVQIQKFGTFYLKKSGGHYTGPKGSPKRWGENFLKGHTRPYIYMRFSPSPVIKKLLNPKPK